jgi:hypothetical protein
VAVGPFDGQAADVSFGLDVDGLNCRALAHVSF